MLGATVNLASAKALIVHSPGTADVFEIKRALDDGDISSRVVGEKAEDPLEEARRKELTELKIKLVAGSDSERAGPCGGRPISFPPCIRFVLVVACCELVMTTPVVFWVGKAVSLSELTRLRGGDLGYEHPRVCGCASAYLYSSVVTFFPHSFETAACRRQCILTARP